MFISIDHVSDWKDLENKVSQLFGEMGYQCTTQKKVKLAGRGKKTVDVHIVDPLASHNQVYLVECKHWESHVHQDIVHAFKTVMEGAGASTGFIISKRGFQSGAYDAIQYTNIQLMTFEELQHCFGNEWFRKQQAELEKHRAQLANIYGQYFEQGSPIPVMNVGKFIDNGLGNELAYFHRQVGNLLSAITSIYPKSYMGPEPVKLAKNPSDPDLPIEDWFEIATVREYFRVVLQACKTCIEDFSELQSKAESIADSLPSDQFVIQTNNMLNLVREETPLRALKGKLSATEYQRLLELLK